MQDLEPLSADELMALSRRLEVAQQYDELERVLRRLISLQPGTAEHAVRLGWSLLALNRPEEAPEIFARISGVPPAEGVTLACGAGIAAYRTGDLKSAVRMLTIAVKGGMAAAEMPLVRAANEIGLFDKALAVTTRMAAASPLDRDIAVLHARQLTYAGDFRAAAEVLLKLFSRKTADSESLELLSQVLVAAGDHKGASNALGQLLRVDFERDEMHALWTHSLAEGFSPLEAADTLGRLIAADPQHCAALFQLAILRERQSNLEEAADLIGRCAALAPHSPLVDGLRGRVALLRGDAATAVRHQQTVWRRMAEIVDEREKPRVPLSAPPESSEPLTPTLYIPVELSSRELLSRLLIALFAARAGFTVAMMGHTVLRQAAHLPRGFVLNKSLKSMDDILVAETRRRGHLLCVIDEEAFGLTGINSLMRCIDAGLLPSCAALFAPGRHYADEIGAVEPGARLVNVGNPRTDLLDPRLVGLFVREAEAVRQAQGRSILICTNFGGWNSRVHHYATVCGVALRAPGVRMTSDFGRWMLNIYQETSETECYDAAAVRSAIPELVRAFPEHKIILRPHPVENPNTWERLFAGAENVVISGTESLHTQMFASDAIIHVPGCGTGVEARLAGRPAICLNPGRDFAYPKLGISGRLSPTARDIPELLRLVKDAIAAKAAAPLSAEQEELLSTHVERPEALVSATIARHLLKMFIDIAGIGPDGKGVVRPVVAELREKVSAAKVRADAAAFGNVGLRAKRFSVSKEKIEGQISALTACLGMAEKFYVGLLTDGAITIRCG